MIRFLAGVLVGALIVIDAAIILSKGERKDDE